MTFWEDSQLGRGHRHDNRADDGHAQAGMVRQQFTFTDIFLLAGLAALAFFALDGFLRDDQASHRERATPVPQRQQVCTDEELRNMHAGTAGCFDTLGPAAREPGHEPSLKSLKSS